MTNVRAFISRLIQLTPSRVIGYCFFVTVLVVAIVSASKHTTANGGGAVQFVYQNDFEPRIEWNYYSLDGAIRPLETRRENGNTFLASIGPWWIDPNHAPPGAGYLSLIAFAHHGSWGYYFSPDGSYRVDRHSGGPPLNKKTALGQFAYPAPIGGTSPLDLRDGRLSFKIRSHANLPDGVALHLWVQTVDASTGKFVNYLLKQSIQTNGVWQHHTLVLSSNDDDWICLSSNANRTASYGCSATIAEALRHFDVDLGFVLFLGKNKPEPLTGEYDFDEISIKLAPGADHASGQTP